MKMFKSDNTASVHPLIMAKMAEVNVDHAVPYGYDPVCLEAEQKIQELFGTPCQVSFVLNGTGANVIGLSTMLKAFHGVICADTAHIHEDECGAFERYTGAKLLTVPHKHGKITPEMVAHHLEVLGNEHHNQPKVISISQLTEWGTAYSLDEIRALADFAHDHNMLLHMDGARIANAVESMGVTFKAMVTDTGVDVLSFGGAKNGMMYGEAIVSMVPSASEELKYSRKQGMQLMSKMRYIGAQYLALLQDDLWRVNAGNANRRMTQLTTGIKDISAIDLVEKPDGNMLFLKLPQSWIDTLLEAHQFYEMTKEGSMGMIRLVTSFDTLESEVAQLVGDLRKLAEID